MTNDKYNKMCVLTIKMKDILASKGVKYLRRFLIESKILRLGFFHSVNRITWTSMRCRELWEVVGSSLTQGVYTHLHICPPASLGKYGCRTRGTRTGTLKVPSLTTCRACLATGTSNERKREEYDTLRDLNRRLHVSTKGKVDIVIHQSMSELFYLRRSFLFVIRYMRNVL